MIRFLVVPLTLAFFLFADGACADPLDPTTSPVFSSFDRGTDTYKQWFRGTKTEDGKTVEMTDAELEAYIEERFENGKPSSDNWLDAFNLFIACLIRVEDRDSPKEDGRKWRGMAVAAAETCLNHDPMDVQIGLWAGKCAKDDKWFRDQLLAIYQKKLDGSQEERAAALFSIGAILDRAEDHDLALEAYAAAHSLYPDDKLISGWLQRCQENLGEYEASLKTLNKGNKDVDMDSRPSLMNEVRRRLEEAELLMKMNRDQKAQETLQAAWQMLERMQALGAEEGDLAVQLNQCATLLGLLALNSGDRDKAVEWFKQSFHEGWFSKFAGLDLRLVEKLMSDPSLRKLCEQYLRTAYDVIYKGDKSAAVLAERANAAKALLDKLLGAEAAAASAGLGANKDADRHAPNLNELAGANEDAASPAGGVPAGGKSSSPQQTGGVDKTVDSSRKNTGAVVAVIAVAALAATIANQRRKKKSGDDNAENTSR